MWRVCSCFSSFAYLLLPFVLSLCSCFLSFILSALSWLSFACPLALSFLYCFAFVVGVAFSLSDVQTKRKGAISCVLSCPVVGLLCKIGFSVLVKFVIVSVNVFCYAFVGVRVFVIIPPLAEKTFENTLDKFPCVELVFYALIYVI